MAATKTSAAKTNMSLWNAVCTSDPDVVKEVSYGKRKFQTVRAQSQIKNATEQFGPMGLFWGVKDSVFTEVLMPNNVMLCRYQGKLWYNYGDATGEIDISASIDVGTIDKYGNYKVDDEYTKKVSTDALTKGLSRLGFNSDIFEGMWDDNRYVQFVHEQKQMTIAGQNQQQPQQANQPMQFQQPDNNTKPPSDVEFVITSMKNCFDTAALQHIANEVQTKAGMNLYRPQELTMLSNAYNEALAGLTQLEQG